MAHQCGDLEGLTVLVAELLFHGLHGLRHQPFQRQVGLTDKTAHDVRQHRPGEKRRRTPLRQRHGFRPQQVDLTLVGTVFVEKQPDADGGGDAAGAVIIVGGGFGGSQSGAAEGVQHPGVHTVAAAKLGFPQKPAVIPGGASPWALRGSPFPAAHAHVFDEGRHFPQHLSPGQTEQQTVAGERRQLGIGGDVGIAVDQIVAQQAVGAVILLNLLPAAVVHGVSHGVPHCQSQQAPTV